MYRSLSVWRLARDPLVRLRAVCRQRAPRRPVLLATRRTLIYEECDMCAAEERPTAALRPHRTDIAARQIVLGAAFRRPNAVTCALLLTLVPNMYLKSPINALCYLYMQLISAPRLLERREERDPETRVRTCTQHTLLGNMDVWARGKL